MPNAVIYNMAGEKVGEYALSEAVFGIEPNEAVLQPELVQVALRGDPGLLNVAELGLGELLGRALVKAELDGIVAFLVSRLLLDDHAGAGLDNGHRNDLACLIEDLRHADLPADDGFLHLYFLLRLLVEAARASAPT